MARAVLFLDVDGVLNSVTTLRECVDQHGALTFGGLHGVAPVFVRRLNAIMEETGADIVVSSTWRSDMPRLCRTLRAAGFRYGHRIVGRTPNGIPCPPHLWNRERRGREIAAWLAQQPEQPSRIVIVDDSDDMAQLRSRLVQTSWRYGLVQRKADRTIKMLRAA